MGNLRRWADGMLASKAEPINHRAV